MGGVSHALNIGPGKFDHDDDDDGGDDDDKHDDGGDGQFICHYHQHIIITISSSSSRLEPLKTRTQMERKSSLPVCYWLCCAVI